MKMIFIKNQLEPLFRLVLAILIGAILVGCRGPSAAALEAVNYTPISQDDWLISTPSEQGLDAGLVTELYYNAAQLETLYGLLVVKNGSLVAEDYFNAGSILHAGNVQSVTKSYISALVGIALEQGCLASIDQKMLDFFPELAGQIQDPRKKEITIRHLLQMRAGYPWEEGDQALWDALWSGHYLPMIVHFPLVSDPGTQFEYSNLTSDWLGMIVARACNTDLKSFAQEYLFSPLGVAAGTWTQDQDGYYMGHGELHFTARDLAKFGLLYAKDGKFAGAQIIAADWLRDSFETYSENAWRHRVGRNFSEIGYGYHWWSARSGDHHYNLAWGHGGQLIFVVNELDMVIVTTANPLYGQTGDAPWNHEKDILNLVADFIAALS